MGRNQDAVDAGDRRQALVALLETLAEQLDNTTTSTHAQLAAQYRAAWAELADLDAGSDTGGTAADDAASRVLRIAGT